MAGLKEENSYRNILKGTSVFGGVQVFQILLALVRGKFVALLLGPAGMGVASLYTTAANTLQQFASLGLNLAIVKEVAAGKDDRSRLSVTFAVARRLILVSGLIGAVVCLLLSPLLSRWTFGDSSHTFGFMMLSVMVFFAIASVGEMSLLQGLHVVKRLSKASIVGGVTGLFVGVPLYYFWGTAGIVPAMIALSFTMFVFYYRSVKKSVDIDKVRFVWREHRPLVTRLVGLGVVLMVSSLIGTFTNYLINLFVRYFGSVDSVGLYQAANSVTNQYVGVVFTAMSLDFFPRLTAIASDNVKMREVVNRQTEVVSLLLTPLVVGLILTAPVIIRLLLTGSFMEIMPLMRWMGFGILLRGLNYPMGYIAFAKDNKRLFFWMEGVFGNLLNLLLSCAGYYMFGLIGLGVSLVVSATVAYVLYYVINSRMYGYGYDRSTLVSALYSVGCGGAAFACSFISDSLVSYCSMGAIFVAVCVVSLIRIKKLSGLHKKQPDID